MSLTLEIPDAVEQALRLPRTERQHELMLELLWLSTLAASSPWPKGAISPG